MTILSTFYTIHDILSITTKFSAMYGIHYIIRVIVDIDSFMLDLLKVTFIPVVENELANKHADK